MLIKKIISGVYKKKHVMKYGVTWNVILIVENDVIGRMIGRR